MPSTITIQTTLNWLTAFLVQRPTTGVGGNVNEPALTTANKIIQTILAAPFRWPWNRAEFTFVTSAPITGVGISDYVENIQNWGWLEKAEILGGSLIDPPVKELEVYQALSIDTDPNQPQKIAPIFDDNGGNITFRLLPPPDAAYTVRVTFQKSPVLVPGLGNTWQPIPDKYAFLYEQGLMAHLQGMYSPQLYLAGMELFFRQLVGAAEGLTETEKNIFLEDKLRDLKTQANAIIATQRARTERG